MIALDRRVIDMRSDTVTKPTAAMRRAIAEAEVGDDVFGEDPAVNHLQERVAELLGKEVGLFCPSGTMANQVALHALTERGDEVFLHARSHILLLEQGGGAVLSQLQLRGFESADGTLDPAVMDDFVHRDDNVHSAPTRLVCLEDTHNRCGGRIYPLEKINDVRGFCDDHGLKLHLDGARIWNAHVATGVPLREIAAPFDTVSVCLSKGLGAPVGSLLVGDAATLALARRARKLFGGGMRQAGLIAAGGLFALDHNVERLADDHRRIRTMATRLSVIEGLAVDVEAVQTNMVYADTRRTGRRAADLMRLLAAEGLLCLVGGPYLLRFVAYIGLESADVEEAAEIVARVVGRLG